MSSGFAFPIFMIPVGIVLLVVVYLVAKPKQ